MSRYIHQSTIPFSLLCSCPFLWLSLAPGEIEEPWQENFLFAGNWIRLLIRRTFGYTEAFCIYMPGFQPEYIGKSLSWFLLINISLIYLLLPVNPRETFSVGSQQVRSHRGWLVS